MVQSSGIYSAFASCGATGGNGSVTQIIAQGAVDAYLSLEASYTFWKVRYNKHTNFALEAIAQPFNTTVQFGAEAQITLNRSGDLVYYMYVVMQVPGITACPTKDKGCPTGRQWRAACTPCEPCKQEDAQWMVNFLPAAKVEGGHIDDRLFDEARDAYRRATTGGCSSLDCCETADDCPTTCCDPKDEKDFYWAHWTNDIGQFLVRQARIIIGGSTIDSLYNDFLFMWEELTGKSGKRLCEMTGKRFHRTALVCDSRQTRILWCPLPFWFTMHSGQALSLASLQFHGVQVSIEFERLENCIVVSNQHTEVYNCDTGCCLTAQDLKAHLETTYVFLDTVERDRFATTHFEVLVVQHQIFCSSQQSSSIRTQLNFNHPIIELIWGIRRRCQEYSNNWFNFSGIDNRDPLFSAALFLNNQSRFGSKPSQYFRLVQPYQHHTNIPDTYVYVYSFALHPEDASPSGSCNFSRIDHVELQLNLQEGLANEPTTLIIFARNWNVLRFREGLAGLGFAN
jgi:hypothetical protein